MRLVNLIKVGTDNEHVVYVVDKEGPYYACRFGSYPLANGNVYKFIDNEDLYVWDTELSFLRPFEPTEGDIAYDQDGQQCSTYKNGKWTMHSASLGSLYMKDGVLCSTEEDSEDVTVPLSIGNYSINIDLMDFVVANFDLIAPMVDAIRKVDEEQYKAMIGVHRLTADVLDKLGFNSHGSKFFSHRFNVS